MIALFLRQHRSWLLLLIVMQLVMNVLLFVDEGIQGVSLTYFNVVWLLAVLTFCAVRFSRDKRNMQAYAQFKHNYYETIEADYKEQLQVLQAKQRQHHLQLLEKHDELLAWVHEMKAPLTAMQLLQDKISESQLQERMQHEWLRLHLLLDQQLHATRLVNIEQDNRLERVELREVVVKEVQQLRSWFFEKQIELDLDDLRGDVISDAKWLGFIVRQLVTNALKYSEYRQQIRIYTTSDNGRVTLHVEDDGAGIAAEDLPRVFRKSYTGTLGREKSAATGMGLYLVKQVADALHIHVSITSEVANGTTVHVQFTQQDAYMKTFSK